MPGSITFDLETKSYADLSKVGQWAYAEDPTTDVICACWGVDHAPIEDWWPCGNAAEDGIPDSLYRALFVEKRMIEAHNAAFEISIWVNVLHKKYGWPLVPLEQWRDTMAIAAYYALPQKLDKLAAVLRFQGKDPEGGRLISKYSKLYLKTAQAHIPDEDFTKFVEYCRQDVRIEQSVSDYLGDFPDRELPIFQMSMRVNQRGLLLDQDGIDAASAIVDQRAEELTAEFRKLTGLAPTQRDKVMVWFEARGLKLDNMQAEYLRALVEEGEIPQGPCRRALEIRLKINKASTKKLDAMSRQRGSDGRARWQTRYHGTATGREAGSGFQPLNMPRTYEADEVPPEQLVGDVMHRNPRLLDALYGDAMEAVGKATRHWIKAAPGHRILACDFSSIEAVVLACLAGEEWKVDAFRRGEKIYEMMADEIYKLPPGTVKKATHPLERQDGKTAELAFGYQGALGAWLKFDSSGRHTDEAIVNICKVWRAKHLATVSFWYGLERAAIEAVDRPGHLTQYRSIGFEMVDEWLSMILPNGKRIWYRDPELRMGMPAWHKPELKPECAEGTCYCEPVLKLSYMSQKEGQWKRVYTYSGKLAENATQATAREIMMQAALRAERRGYHIVLSVYDELVCEEPEGFGSLKELEDLMKESPGPWAAGWPIQVDGWEGVRYRK